MWPWQAFDWGVFWAIIVAGAVYLVIANIINFTISALKDWGERAP
jgi:ABC-type arginine transport system permease subunit